VKNILQVAYLLSDGEGIRHKVKGQLSSYYLFCVLTPELGVNTQICDVSS
jgi:hypothetical protein